MFASARVASRRAAAAGAAACRKASTRVAASAAPRFSYAVAACAVAAAGAAAMQKQQPECRQSSVPYTGVPGTAQERSFIAIKPDGVQRGLIADIIARFEKKGFKLVAMKMIWPTEEMAAKHYDDLKARPFFPALVKYFASGPVIAMCWEGPGVILTGRKLLGATNPSAADVGTIRGDYCIVTGRNVIHGSDGPESAKHEIGMWFKEEECSDWPRSMDSWMIADN